jgi:hypothetical protein
MVSSSTGSGILRRRHEAQAREEREEKHGAETGDGGDELEAKAA